MDKNHRTDAPPHSGSVTLETRVQILFEEYRALYSLLTFRLTAMDRRLPAIGGTLAGILASTTAMPDPTRMAFLLGLPIALVMLFLSTVQHARSKEDHLRRIDEIETLVNGLVGEELLVFQSRHPNKARHTGGRTGFGSVLAILSICLLMLAGGVYALQASHLNNFVQLASYAAYSFVCAAIMLAATRRLHRYRYQRPSPHATSSIEPQSRP